MAGLSNALPKLAGQVQRNLLGVVAGAYLLLFSLVWIWIGYRLLSFNATPDHPRVEFAILVTTVAGFMATSVLTLAAGMLGIEIQKVQSRQNEEPLADKRLYQTAGKAFGASALLAACVLDYLLVGGFVLVVALTNADQASDMIQTFAFSVLGFLAGGLAAAARAGSA